MAFVSGSSCLHPVIPHGCLSKTTSAFYSSFELNIVFCSVLKLQRWWRSVLALKLRTKSAVLIQSRIREWLARQKASREKHCSVVIQVRYYIYVAPYNVESLLFLRVLNFYLFCCSHTGEVTRHGKRVKGTAQGYTLESAEVFY